MHIIGGGRKQPQAVNMGHGDDPTKMKIDLNDCEDVKCPCGGSLFIPTMRLKRLSQLQSPTGKEEIMQIPFVLICHDCNKPVLPEVMTGDKKKDVDNNKD